MSGSIKNRAGIGMGVVFAGVIVLGALATGLVAASTTYSVTFTEVGLPSGTTWSLYFGGTSYTPTTTSFTITGLSSGSYYWYFSTLSAGTGVQYVTTGLTGGYMSVPTQTTQSVVYQKQYLLTMVVTPSSGGTINPGGTFWENAGAQVPITASHYTGYSFGSWKVPKSVGNVANTKSEGTLLTVNNTGTVTASMKALQSTGAFSEIGLPAGTSWSVVFGGALYSSSTATLSIGSHPTGNYGWSIATVSGTTGVQYAPNPSGGSMNMPWLGAQTIVFAKEDLLTFAVGPTGGGSTSPTTGYYLDNVPLPIVASASSGYKFSSWASGSAFVTFNNTARSSTTVIATAPATITAKFATGTTCTKCTATFYELGLPTGTTWDIVVGGTTYFSTSTSIVLTGMTTAFYYSTPGYLAAGTGVTYQPTPTSNYFNIPYQSSVTLEYQKFYLLAFGESPSYQISLYPSQTNWYPAGSTIPLVASGNDNWVLQSWSSSSKALTLSSKNSAALDVVVGAPGTITANLVSPLKTVEFAEVGLPAHSIWALGFNGQTFYSSGWDLNITSVPTYQNNYWNIPTDIASLTTYGVQYAPWNPSGYLQSVYTPFVLVEFVQQDLVGFVAGGTTGGSVYPSSAAWYNIGTVLAIDALNGTSVHFTKWTSVGGPFTVAQTTWASTVVTIAGPGNLTATFK